jgi:hypothetical protein
MAHVTRLRSTPGGVDIDGYPVVSTTTETELGGVFVAPRQSLEITDRARAGVIVGLTLYGPIDTDIVHTDRLRVDGVLYEVDGEVGQWTQPMSGWRAGLTVALSRVTG